MQEYFRGVFSTARSTLAFQAAFFNFPEFLVKNVKTPAVH